MYLAVFHINFNLLNFMKTSHSCCLVCKIYVDAPKSARYQCLIKCKGYGCKGSMVKPRNFKYLFL